MAIDFKPPQDVDEFIRRTMESLKKELRPRSFDHFCLVLLTGIAALIFALAVIRWISG